MYNVCIMKKDSMWFTKPKKLQRSKLLLRWQYQIKKQSIDLSLF